MKKQKQFITFAVSFLLVATSYGQVVFSNMSLQDALRQAKAEDKLVLFMIEAEDCKQCNDVALQAFQNPILAKSVNSNCIPVKLTIHSAEYAIVDSIYTIANTIGLLFIDTDGTLIHRYAVTTGFYLPYMDQINQAIKKKEHPDTAYKQAQTAYNNGTRDFGTLYQLVKQKNNMQINHDLLTEEMLNLAPADSATSLTFIQFLAEQAPVAYSNTYQYMHKNNQNFNDAWYLMTTQKRSAINNKIIVKSRTKAIHDKDILYAERVANFAAVTNTDRVQSRKAHDRNMIEYFKGVKDTASFLAASARFYDQFFMTINADSVMHIDSIRRSEYMQARLASRPPMPDTAGKKVTVTRSLLMTTSRDFFPGGIQPFIPIAQNYASDLNYGAWTIYTFTHDPVYTAKALSWAKHANEFAENFGAMDTYARLLYRSGQKQEALNWEDKTVQFCKSKTIPADEYEEVFKKMKAGVPVDKY